MNKLVSRGTFAGLKLQRGAFALGMVVGLLVGLALALGVALYITKVPVPFVNKVPQRTAEQDSAETERNRRWDPNAPLGGKPAARPAAASAAGPFPPAPAPAPTVATAPPAPTPGAPVVSTRDPVAILSGAPVPPPAQTAPAAAPKPGAVAAGTAGTAATPAAAGTAGTPAAAPARSTAPQVDAFVYFVQAGAYTRNDDAEHQRARLGLMGYTATISEREQSGRTMYRVRVGPLRSRDEADGMQQRLQEAAIETQIVRVERP
jgi:cell division protein FtsN